MNRIYQWLSFYFSTVYSLIPSSKDLLVVDVSNINHFNCKGNLIQPFQVRKLDILRSIVRYGYRSYFNFPLQLRLLKIPYIFYILDFSNRNLRIKSDVYSLEKSEKADISYELGMIFSHLVAEMQTNVVWTLHLSLAKYVGINIGFNGNSKPDLIGCDTQNNYYVIEAKGTLCRCKGITVRNAKKQLNSINSINNRSPQKFVSYFVSSKNRDSKVFWVDPQGKGDIDLKIKMEDFIFLHYFRFMQLMQSFQEVLEDKNVYGHEFKVIPLGNICIGLEKELFSELDKVMSSWNEFKNSKDSEGKFKIELFKEKAEKMKGLKSEMENDENISLGRDGTIVKFSPDSN